MSEPEKPTVTYWALSVLSSRTMWFNAANFIVGALTLSEVVVLIPPRYLPLQAMVVALINMWLRKATVRPVAFVGMGDTKPIRVTKVDLTAPPKVSD